MEMPSFTTIENFVAYFVKIFNQVIDVLKSINIESHFVKYEDVEI